MTFLAALSNRYPRLDRATREFFELWDRAMPWLLCIAGPVGLAYWLIRGGLFGMPLWLPAVMRTVWGLALPAMLWILAWSEARKAALTWQSDLHA